MSANWYPEKGDTPFSFLQRRLTPRLVLSVDKRVRSSSTAVLQESEGLPWKLCKMVKILNRWSLVLSKLLERDSTVFAAFAIGSTRKAWLELWVPCFVWGWVYNSFWAVVVWYRCVKDGESPYVSPKMEMLDKKERNLNSATRSARGEDYFLQAAELNFEIWKAVLMHTLLARPPYDRFHRILLLFWEVIIYRRRPWWGSNSQ